MGSGAAGAGRGGGTVARRRVLRHANKSRNIQQRSTLERPYQRRKYSLNLYEHAIHPAICLRNMQFRLQSHIFASNLTLNYITLYLTRTYIEEISGDTSILK